MGNDPRSTAPSDTGKTQTLAGAVAGAASSIHGTVENMATAADDAIARAKPAIGRAAGMAHNSVDQVARVAGPAAQWLGDTGETLKSTGTRVVKGSCAFVAANPMKSIATALVAGFLLGRTMR